MKENVKITANKMAFVDALLELLIEKEYEKISVTDLCDKVGVVRKTFYNNFSSKDGVIYFAIYQIFMEFEGRIDLKNMSLVSVFKEIFSFAYANKESMSIFYRRGLFSFVWESLTKTITREHLISKINLEAIQPTDYKYLTAYLASTFISVLEIWIKSDFSDSVEHVAMLTEFLLNQPKVIE